MRKTIALIGVGALLVGASTAAQGPLTPWATAKGRTDSNGYVMIASGTYTAPDGPLTPFANLRVRTDANGYLITTGAGFSGGAVTTPITLPDGTVGVPALSFTSDTDTGLYRIGANNLGIAANGAKVLDIGTVGLALTGTLTATSMITAGLSDANAQVGIGSISSGYPGMNFGTSGARIRFGKIAANMFRWSDDADTSGFQVSVATNGTAAFLALGGGDTAVVSARTFATSGSTGCTGAPTASTRGINTTCAAPESLHVLTSEEWSSLQSQIAELRALVNELVRR